MMFSYNLLIRTGKGSERERRWNSLLLPLPLDEEAQRKNLRIEAWLRGFISFTDLCAIMGWDAAERRATMEGLGIKLPEWNERAKLLAWTERQPTEAGFYWMRYPDDAERQALMVYVSTITLKASVRVFTGSWMDMPEGCQWAGPLPMPILPGTVPPAPTGGHAERTEEGWRVTWDHPARAVHDCPVGATCDVPGCINCPPKEEGADG